MSSLVYDVARLQSGERHSFDDVGGLTRWKRNFRKKFTKDIATKPRQPTSNGSKWTFHPSSRIKSAKSEYFRFFRWLAFVIFSSQGHVNSSNMTVFVSRDHIMRSGRSGVSMINGGTISGTSGRSSRNSQSTAPSSRECLFFGGCLHPGCLPAPCSRKP